MGVLANLEKLRLNILLFEVMPCNVVGISDVTVQQGWRGICLQILRKLSKCHAKGNVANTVLYDVCGFHRSPSLTF
jgi:hypothetical protein